MRLGIVSPCYNEHEVLYLSAQKLTTLFDELIAKGKIDSDSFVLFVNDGSRDNTWEIICDLHKNNRYFSGINLAHNVGHQNAIMAGMMTARTLCDAVITIDADLQDDINAIEEMIDRYNEGYDIVYGVKVSRKADPFLKRTSAQLFYRFQNAMGLKTIPNHADFRLMSSRALEELSHYDERNLYLRGIVPLLGYRTTTVNDVISEREAGASKYTISKMLNLAVDGITSFSIRPIRLIFSAGLFFLLISIFITIYILYSYFVHSVVPGWTSMMLSLWFIGSIILLAIGVVGEYIGKIYVEVKMRPRYNIEQFIHHENDKAGSVDNNK